jgi:hypothetical protein
MFPRKLADVSLPTAGHGNLADADSLRAASVRASVVADAMARCSYIDGTRDLGLRGGSWKAKGDNTIAFTFKADQWVTDASVSGTATWNQASGKVEATLTVSYDSGETATIAATWNAQHTVVPVELAGTANGAALVATVPVS